MLSSSSVSSTAVFFCILNWSLPRLIKKFVPNFYNVLDTDKQESLPSWAAGMFHHFVVAPFGMYMVYVDYNTPASVYDKMDYAKDFYGLNLLTYAFGYIMADTIFFTLPEIWKGKYEYLIHHAASLGLYRGILMTGGPIIRFIPHFMICESSNAIFNTAWFLRNGGGQDTAILRILEMLFVVVFFVLRIINLPLSIYIMLNLPGVEVLGHYRYVLVPIMGLQFMWFYMIIVAMMKKLRPKAKKPVVKAD